MENHLEILKAPWVNRKSAFPSALLEIPVIEVYTVRRTVQGESGSTRAGLAFVKGVNTETVSLSPGFDSS